MQEVVHAEHDPVSSVSAVRSLAVVCSVVALFGISVAWILAPRTGTSIDFLAWLLAVSFVGMLPIYTDAETTIDLDLPVLVAAACLLGPALGAALALLSMDPREWRGEIDLTRALFNRAQKAIGVLLAGVAFAATTSPTSIAPVVALGVVVAVAADIVINGGIMILYVRSSFGLAPAQAFSGMVLDSPRTFLIAYLGYGLLAAILVFAYGAVGVFTLVLFAPAVLVARFAFLQSRGLSQAGRQLREKSRALAYAEGQIARERADERLTIAGALHDDVLQSLHFLTLHAQVIREDLRNGRLLQLEEDIPDLLRISQETASLTREIVGELRESPLGRSGLRSTVAVLTTRLRDEFTGDLEVQVDDFTDVDSAKQLVCYQVIREAMTNSVKHARAQRIAVEASVRHEELRVVISDDGVGFSSDRRELRDHFGMHLMRDRVEGQGGTLTIKSEVGKGTSVAASIPR